MNAEGYSDPTADKAIRNATAVPDNISQLVKIFKIIASLAGYEITERIVFRDKETGKEWR